MGLRAEPRPVLGQSVRHQADLLAIVAARPIETSVGYVVFYAATVACSLPEGALVTLAGGLLFGTALGGTLAIIGASTGAVILFLAARYAFADLMAAKAAPFMARIRPGIERDGSSTSWRCGWCRCFRSGC